MQDARSTSRMRAAIYLILAVSLSLGCSGLSFVQCPQPATTSTCCRLTHQSRWISQRSTPRGGPRDPFLTARFPTVTVTSHEASVKTSSNVLRSSAGDGGEAPVTVPAPGESVAAEERKLPFFLDPNTRGGAVVVPVLSLLLPIAMYGAAVSAGVDSNKAGTYAGVAYTLIALVAWVGSYFFRVATKNMTYATQLKNYEQAVIEKRFSELDEEEKDALLDEVNEA